MNPFEQVASAPRWVLLPLMAVWLLVVIDIMRQPGLSRGARAAWILACTLVWPTQAVYLLVRPQRARVEAAEVRTDPHARLVGAILDHQSGRIDDAGWRLRADALRSGSGARPLD